MTNVSRGFAPACQKEGAEAPFVAATVSGHPPFSKGSVTARDIEPAADDEGLLFRETRVAVRELKEFRDICADFAADSGISLRTLDAADLLDVLPRDFNPRSYYERSFVPLNPHAPFAAQVIFNSPVLDHAGITREGVKTRTISLKTSPRRVYPGGMAYFTRLPFPFRLAQNFSFPGAAKVKRFLDVKEFFLQNTPSARSQRQRQEILDVQDRLAGGDRCVQLTFTVIVEGTTDDELDARTREVLGVFQNDLGLRRNGRRHDRARTLAQYAPAHVYAEDRSFEPTVYPDLAV